MKKPIPIKAKEYDYGISVYEAWNPLIEILNPLDFFCTRSDGLIGLGIRIVSKNFSPDRKADYNHAGIFPEGNEKTLEALNTLTSKNFFEEYENKRVLIARWKKMTPELAKCALEKTNKHVGQRYPYYRIAFHLINVAHLIHWRKLVCSEYVAKNLYYPGCWHEHYYGTTPDMLADAVKHELNEERTGPKFDIVHENRLPVNYYKYCVQCKSFYLLPLHIQECPKQNHNLVLNGFKSPNEELNIKINNYNTQKAHWEWESIQNK